MYILTMDNNKNDQDIGEEDQESEVNKRLYFKSVDKLYRLITKNYRDGDMLMYDPYIFSNLRHKDFVDWLLANNEEIADILNEI